MSAHMQDMLLLDRHLRTRFPPGVNQDRYGETLPGITQHHGGRYGREVVGRLTGVADRTVAERLKYRNDAQGVMRQLENSGMVGFTTTLLEYRPAMRVARLLSAGRPPMLLANIQSEPNVTPA